MIQVNKLPHILLSILVFMILWLGCVLMIEDRVFKIAISHVLSHEGGYSNDANDLGGETKFGITKRFYPNLDIKNLTLDQAIEIYYKDYWKKGAYPYIKDEKIATKIFDMAINIGPTYANRILQRSLRSLGHNVPEDSVIGLKTLNAVNAANSDRLLIAIKSEAAGHYRLIASKRPTNQKFLKGWLNRAYSNPV